MRRTITSVFLFLLLVSIVAVPCFAPVHVPPGGTITVAAGATLHSSDGSWISTTGTAIHISSYYDNGWFSYTVDGAGTQQLYNATKPITVVIDGTTRSIGDGWTQALSIISITSATTSVAMRWSDALVVTLDSPSNGATTTDIQIDFKYTPASYGDVITAARLWTNVSGLWQIVAMSTSVSNGVQNTLYYAYPGLDTYIWNVQISNTTNSVYAPTTFTFSIVAKSSPPGPSGNPPEETPPQNETTLPENTTVPIWVPLLPLFPTFPTIPPLQPPPIYLDPFNLMLIAVLIVGMLVLLIASRRRRER